MDLHFPDPDVAEADRFAGIAMRLQTDRACPMFYDFRETDVFRSTQDSRVILQYDAVLDDRNARRDAIKCRLP